MKFVEIEGAPAEDDQFQPRADQLGLYLARRLTAAQDDPRRIAADSGAARGEPVLSENAGSANASTDREAVVSCRAEAPNTREVIR